MPLVCYQHNLLFYNDSTFALSLLSAYLISMLTSDSRRAHGSSNKIKEKEKKLTVLDEFGWEKSKKVTVVKRSIVRGYH